MSSPEPDNQEQLFQMHVVGTDRDHTLARATDPETSHEGDAAVRKREGASNVIQRGKHRHRALACFVNGPLSAEEVVFATGIDGVWKRVSELKTGGFIAKTGKKRTSTKGCNQDLLELTDAGRAALVRLGPV